VTGDHHTQAEPRVSVIVVVYNERKRIADCLASLRGQRFESAAVETIVIDDGSDDGTPDVVEETFPEARLIRKANEGADLSRNRGIEESRGRIIAFLDSDCVARPDWVASMVAALDERPASVAGGRVVHRGPLLRRVTGIADFGEYQGEVGRTVRSLPTCNLGLRRSTLGGVRFDPRVASAGGDTVFTECLRRGGATLRYEPRMVVEHRPPAGFADFVRRSRRYGASFVRARRADPGLRYAGLIRAGIPGVVAAAAARTVLDWTRLLRHRRAAGFALWELPAAATALAVGRAASLPAAIRAVGEEI